MKKSTIEIIVGLFILGHVKNFIIKSSVETGARVLTGFPLKMKGFEKLYSLKGGISAWQNANLPLTKGKV